MERGQQADPSLMDHAPVAGTMESMARRPASPELVGVRGIHVLGALQVRLLFSDGLVRDLDLAPLMSGPAFARHREEPAFFARARVRHGTVTWPDDSDLDPLVLHGDEKPARGGGPRVVGESFPSSAVAS